jgi:hypothetical protein
MTTMTLSQSTQDAISVARTQGPGTNNQNYVAAYNAISGDISSHGGFDPGTTYWFSLAGSINGQQFNPSPAGTFIYNYTKAAAQSEGTTLTQAQMQQASDKIASTVFNDLDRAGYVFSDQPVQGQPDFSPKSIIATDAGSGLDELRRLNPGSNLDATIWGGTLFARTTLNDPTYFSDYNIDLTPGSRDCAALTTGSVQAANNSFLQAASELASGNVTGALDLLWTGQITGLRYLDTAAIKQCFPGQQGSLAPGSTLTEDSEGNLTFGQTAPDGSSTSGTVGNNNAYADVTATAANGTTNALIAGQGDVTNLSNAAVTLSSGSSATIIGGADTVNVGSGASLSLTGNNNSLVLTASSAVNVTGTGESVSGSGAAVTLGANSSATFSGSGNTINASQGDVITENNAVINVAQGASVTIAGTGDIIVGAGNNTINLTGGGDTVNLNGAGNTVMLAGNGNADTVNGDIAGDNVTLSGGTTATVNGSGGVINLGGTGDTLTASNETINTAANSTGVLITGSGDTVNAAAGFSGNLIGGGDTIHFNGGNDYVGVYGSGSANTVTGDVASDNIGLVSGTLNVTGSGGSIGLFGSGATVNASNENIYTMANLTGELFNGSGNTIDVAAGFSGNVMGGGDTIHFDGANDYVGVYGSGSANTVTGDVASDNIGLVSGTLNVTGSGGSIGLFGSGATVNASNENIYTMANLTGELFNGSGNTIDVAAGFSGNVIGSSDTVNFSGTGSYVGLLGNPTNDVVNGNITGDSVGVVGNTTATINGAGGMVGIFGNTNNLTTSNETVYTTSSVTGENVYGSGNTVNAASGFDGNVIGGGNIVTFNGTNNYVGLIGNGNSDTLYGDVATDNVGITAGTVATINGSGGQIGIFGSGATVTASNEHIYDPVANMTNETFIGSHDVIDTSAGFNGAVYGGGDTVNLSGGGNVLTLHGNNVSTDIVTGDNPGNDVALTGSMTAEVRGNGGIVRLNESNETVTTSNERVFSGSNLTGEIVNGSSDTISAGDSFSVTVAGANDTVNLGTGSHVLLTSGDNNDDVHGDHDTIVAQPNVIDYVYGSADTYNGQFGNFEGDPVNGPGDDGSSFWDDWWPDDPVVLNLDGGAVQTQGLQGSAAFFDMQNNGERVHTGWVTSGEGLLVYDPDGSNSVTGDRDLVAGFDALKELTREVDGASSGTLSASDAIWSKLKVWVDSTGTGDFHSDQLYTLGQLGISSINLNAANVQTDSNGNTILADSSFTRSDGSSGDIAGVALRFASSSAAGANLAAQSQQLISAMASFAAPEGGVLPMIAGNQNSLPITLAAGQR